MSRHDDWVEAPTTPPRVCLTIAGSDSSGGAGIQADLKTFEACGVFGASVITAVTAQNTQGVRGVGLIDPALIRSQIEAVRDDLPVAAIKVGMVGDTPAIEAVAEALRLWRAECPTLPIVIDPVAVARSGDRLLNPAAFEALVERLLPLANVVTPNRRETAWLSSWISGCSVGDLDAIPDLAHPDDLEKAGRLVFQTVRRPVLVKGGAALPGALDWLIDAEGVTRFTVPHAPLKTTATHGSGCVLAAALTVGLARGLELREAVGWAKQFVTRALSRPPGLGKGHGPLGIRHGWQEPDHDAKTSSQKPTE
ncbi:phosphomethylpyrimidine kinase [Isosphaera pallida ATCC 43644]|uniref:hydroxymethylpyrimidine kinase n=1 Tax=Isosphaera pallida (strain ATCC 43644 / DSM 9630 / IS1B) TaxID=575540 RepID=E8R388_ISOPI|nr:bifunctional hydroxymethylpyrimidine kinase/phosphomethylpyrimidine kinase [Isosphaera pallida]ADV62607.1 phosphomethylpyrimidine kinase [Isosphaera pallida ATCC 43644]